MNNEFPHQALDEYLTHDYRADEPVPEPALLTAKQILDSMPEDMPTGIKLVELEKAIRADERKKIGEWLDSKLYIYAAFTLEGIHRRAVDISTEDIASLKAGKGVIE